MRQAIDLKRVAFGSREGAHPDNLTPSARQLQIAVLPTVFGSAALALAVDPYRSRRHQVESSTPNSGVWSGRPSLAE